MNINMLKTKQMLDYRTSSDAHVELDPLVTSGPSYALGKRSRLNRLFDPSSRRLCSIAVDHWFGYRAAGREPGLQDLPATLATLMPGRPSAVTMTKGAAQACWGPHAGSVPLIIQAGCFTPDDRVIEITADPEECLRLGAEAMAVAIGVRGAQEGRYLRLLCDSVRAAARFDLPIIAHIYPRDFSGREPRIVFAPEEIEWAVRCGIECGADIIKVGYTGDVASFRSIVAACPVPVIAAGGPKAPTLLAALTAMAEAVVAGGRGATMGRNIWGLPRPAAALAAFKAVILGGVAPRQALQDAGLDDGQP